LAVLLFQYITRCNISLVSNFYVFTRSASYYSAMMWT